MFDLKKIEQFAYYVQEALPKEVQDLGEDIEKRIRHAIYNYLCRINLVSREEFDTQAEAVLCMREKIKQLELHLNALESKLKENVLLNTVICNKKVDH